MLPAIFKPSASYALTRLGRDQDGGYLVENSSIEQAAQLVSFGLGYDWSFEEDFLKHKEIPLRVYDHTVGEKDLRKRLRRTPRIRWLKKYLAYKRFFNAPNRGHHETMIGYEGGGGGGAIGLDRVLRDDQFQYPAFVKIDIEGTEYRILDDLVLHSSNICGLAIEFHDVDLHQYRIVDFLEKFPLTLVHVHGNNYSGVDPTGKVLVIEMSFARDPSQTADEPSIPHPLDRPNHPKKPEIRLSFEPSENDQKKTYP